MYIYIYIYIYVCVCVCVKKCVESSRMYVEKVKWKKDICLMVCLFAKAFQLQSFFLNAKIFYQNYFRMRNNYDR